MEITVLDSCFAQFLAAEDLLMQPYSPLAKFVWRKLQSLAYAHKNYIRLKLPDEQALC